MLPPSRGPRTASALERVDWLDPTVAMAALDALDLAVLVLSADLSTVLHANRVARELCNGVLTPALREAVEGYLAERGRCGRRAAVRVRDGERAFYLRVVPATSARPVEVVILRQDVLRDADLYRQLQMRYGVAMREYQVLNGLRVGKTNRAIADELGLAVGTVARHLHRLLQRFGAQNRTMLVHMVEDLARRD